MSHHVMLFSANVDRTLCRVNQRFKICSFIIQWRWVSVFRDGATVACS